MFSRQQLVSFTILLGSSNLFHQSMAFLSHHHHSPISHHQSFVRPSYRDTSRPPLFPITTTVTTATEPSTASSSSLSAYYGLEGVTSVIQSDPALVAGFVMICMATFPYVLGIIYPGPLFNSFFIPIYKDETEQDVEKARDAEIYWKLMYATLGLFLTILAFGEAVTTDRNVIEILKDSYIGWAVFYTAATFKIKIEDEKFLMLRNSRVGIQIWHSLVVIVLWLSVAGSERLVHIFDVIFDWDKLVAVLTNIFGS
ncbi:hypothetical protein ACA910_015420 [Epithemia clementina (nom. ined.)]